MKHIMKLLVIGLVIFSGVARAESSDITVKNLAATEQAFSQWQEGTGSPFGLLADDAVWKIEGYAKTSGSYSPAEIQELIVPFNNAIASRLIPTIPTLYAYKDTVVARFTASAPLKAGGIYTNTYAWFMRFENEKIVEVHAFLDLPAFEATFN